MPYRGSMWYGCCHPPQCAAKWCISASCDRTFSAWGYLASHSPWNASGNQGQGDWARCSSCAGPKAKIQTRKINLLPSSWCQLAQNNMYFTIIHTANFLTLHSRHCTTVAPRALSCPPTLTLPGETCPGFPAVGSWCCRIDPVLGVFRSGCVKSLFLFHNQMHFYITFMGALYLWDCCSFVPVPEPLTGSGAIGREPANKNKETYTNRPWLHKQFPWEIRMKDHLARLHIFFPAEPEEKACQAPVSSSDCFTETCFVTFSRQK